MTRWYVLLCGLLICLPPSAWALDSPAESEKGVEILFGMSSALSGPAAELGREMRRGVLAGFQAVNRRGGLDGRPLRLLSLDDGYEPSRTAPNMQQLLSHENLLAVIGNVGTPTAIAALPLIRSHRALFFAPFSGAGALRRDPPERYVMNIRASYAEEIAAMVDALILRAGLQPRDIAFFTQRDGYGDAGYVGGFAALKQHGLKDEQQVLHVRYRRNTLAVENALADLLLAEHTPRAVILVGAYAPCAKFIRLAKASGLEALFLNVSFVGSDALARELGDAGEGVIITQVVPHPRESLRPLVVEYRRDLAQFDAGAPSFVSLEGYLAARVLLLGLSGVKGELTRENLIDALEDLKTFDPGLNLSLRFDAEHHQASHRVWPTMVRQGQVVGVSWAEAIRHLPGRGRP